MRKIITLLFVSALLFSASNIVYAGENKDTKDITVKSGLFSVTVPGELKGLFSVKKEKTVISFFEKKSKKAGFGGFAFGIKAYKNPADHANLPGGVKIGELTDKKGNIYDMVLKRPTDVQFDYTKGEKAPEVYNKLYDAGDNPEIEGIKGAKYYKDKGMKGEELYPEVLQKHLTAIKEKYDSEKLENENMSYMYNVLTHTNKNVGQKIGYVYYDLNGDGIEELLIGEIAKDNRKGIIYDIYTIADRKPVHVISGGSRNRYYVCNDVFICNEYSSGANESGIKVFFLEENSTVLFPQVEYKYDGYSNPEKPWYIIYGENDKENVDKKTYEERLKIFGQYKRFDFIPLERLNPEKSCLP